MSDFDISRARDDLTRVSSSAWVEVYGEATLDEICRLREEAEDLRQRMSNLGGMTIVLGHARRAVDAIVTALDAFEKITGWVPGRKLKVTPRRWTAACGLAATCRTATNGFLASSRPFLRQIAGQPDPADLAAADRMEAVVTEARSIAPDTPEVAEKLQQFEESTWKIRDRLLRLKRHPVSSDARYIESGGVEPAIEIHGQCSHIGPGGRCWLYADHPGDHQYRRGPKPRKDH